MMKVFNYKEKINLYKKINPNLDFEEIGLILILDDLYKEIPSDINFEEFKRIYPHINPDMILKDIKNRVKFLDLIEQENFNKKDVLEQLNNYVNIKFNHINNFKSYEKNMIEFKQRSKLSSIILDRLLKRTHYPKEIISFFKESEIVEETHDFYELLDLYRNSNSTRMKFEILRKIGIIFLISRIHRTFVPHEIEHSYEQIQESFRKGFGLNKKFKSKNSNKKTYYYFLTKDEKIIYSTDYDYVLKKHNIQYNKNSKISHTYNNEIEKIEFVKNKSKNHNVNFCLQFRNKFEDSRGEIVNYISIIEKMIRKNLEFPTQIHDILGVRIIVEKKEDIPNIILELEEFLGGSSTRKKEKDALNKFGMKRLNKYASDKYFVWKAVYDITIPHDSLDIINKLKEEFSGNRAVIKKINDIYQQLYDVSKDVVLEIQIQDIDSYLLANIENSSSNHRALKMNQMKKNTFYKLFPKEIYEKELNLFKSKILHRD